MCGKIVIKYYAVVGNEYKNMSYSKIKFSESPVTHQSSSDARVVGYQMVCEKKFQSYKYTDGYTYIIELSIIIYEFSGTEILKTILF